MAFTLPDLPYSHDALAPTIDAKTMELHHTKHHQAYITKLNDAVESDSSLQGKDLETGAEQHWWAGPVSTLQEPCFIPRSKHAPEGDGWIVQVCNRLAEHRSDLLLFDALEIEKGPIATINVPIRLRFGLHGNFAPSEELGLAA